MSDGTTDRGAKPPRTLFSLGRPGPKSSTAEAEPAAADASTEPVADATETDIVELACGACGATLISGGVFCGECGTPVAMADDEPFDLVEEVPMGDLEDPNFGEYIEELPIDETPAVLYADGEPTAESSANGSAPHTIDDTDSSNDGGTVIAQPAAVLYADPTKAEPLPPAPSGSFAISEPSYGTADGAIDGSDRLPEGEADVDPATTDDDGVGAAPFVAAAAAGAAVLGAAAVGGEASAEVADVTTATGTEAAASETAAADIAATETAAATEVAGSEAGATELAGADAAAGEAGAETVALPWADAPTTAEPVVPPITEPATTASPVVPAAAVAGAAYTTTPPSSDGGGKSKTGLLVGVAAAIVLLLIVGGIIIVAGGTKDDSVQTAQQNTTTVAPTSTTTAPTSTTAAPSTSTGPTTTVAPTSTAAPASTETTAAPITTASSVLVPTTPRPTVTQAPPTTTIQPGRIEASPAAGGSVSIPKGGSMQIMLTNVGGSQASCALTGSAGITASQNCSPSIAPGQTVYVTVIANPTWEGPATVSGVLEGAGSYHLTVNVQNA